MKRVTYLRLYADESGESHFEELEIDLPSVDFAPPAAPLNVARFLPATSSVVISAPVGWAGEEPHPAPRRQVFCTLQGEYEVTASDGDVRSLPTGSILLLEDTWGKGHSTRITSDEDVLIFGAVLEDT